MIEPDATHALASAVSHVNVSMPTAMTVNDLRAALHAVLDETAVEIVADLVRAGAVSHVHAACVRARAFIASALGT